MGEVGGFEEEEVANDHLLANPPLLGFRERIEEEAVIVDLLFSTRPMFRRSG